MKIGFPHHPRMSHCAPVVTVVDHVRSRVYDPRYLVTTHAPRGRTSHLRSPASTWTRANLAAALEPRLNAVVDHLTIHEQWRSPLQDDRSDRARSSPRGTCRPGRDQRSRPAQRVDVNGLRTGTASHWRQGDVARPAICPGQGRPGLRTDPSCDPRGLCIGLDSAARVRCEHSPRRHALNSPRSFARRPAASATAWRPSLCSHTTHTVSRRGLDRRLTTTDVIEPR